MCRRLTCPFGPTRSRLDIFMGRCIRAHIAYNFSWLYRCLDLDTSIGRWCSLSKLGADRLTTSQPANLGPAPVWRYLYLDTLDKGHDVLTSPRSLPGTLNLQKLSHTPATKAACCKRPQSQAKTLGQTCMLGHCGLTAVMKSGLC